jgi:hypothetical protein
MAVTTKEIGRRTTPKAKASIKRSKKIFWNGFIKESGSKARSAGLVF